MSAVLPRVPVFDGSKISTYYDSKGALSSYYNKTVDSALAAAASAGDQNVRKEDFKNALTTA